MRSIYYTRRAKLGLFVDFYYTAPSAARERTVHLPMTLFKFKVIFQKLKFWKKTQVLAHI